MEIQGVSINYLGHSGFLIINSDGKRIAIDPYNISDNIDSVDFILITHGHYDHCSIKDISKISGFGTVIICPPDVQSKITRVEGIEMQVIQSGDELDFEHLKIRAFPAYNIGKQFHTKADEWNGYLIKFEKMVIYHAGDTDLIPEMKKLAGYGKQGQDFIALLPVSGTYVMDSHEACEAASIIHPSLAIPMHYGAGVAGTIEDAKDFVKLCKNKGIDAEVLERI
jgi:L-ascorbate metabolism protein UlaG (beta-lactamase superfamily)